LLTKGKSTRALAKTLAKIKNEKMNKHLFDIIFITVSATLLIIFVETNVIEKFIGFALIPILIAYFLGQYAERKFKK